MKEKNKEKNSNVGVITLIVCSIITLILIIACIFFPDQIFGIFTK